MLGHARDPYHRVDAVPSSRHVRVWLDGVLVADSRRTVVIFETSLVPRWYIPREDVLVELLPGTAQTVCAYKGRPVYWSVRTPAGLRENIAWTYENPLRDALPVAGLVCFFDEQADVEVDGERRRRQPSPWAGARWWERTPRIEDEM